ncbi:MAG: endonuclease III [Bacilli bacterium]|nr:endonuclease III [Bacilli bacterium]
MEKIDRIINKLNEMYPDNKGDLHYSSIFQLIVAVTLSAQTTDIAVNKATIELFKKYPTEKELAVANINDVKEMIKTIGLYNNKAKNIIEMARILVNNEGIIEPNLEFLTNLPGVGRKTANVVLSEGFKIPRIAVDTHVFRVSRRLGLSNSNNVLKVEEDLMNLIDEKMWGKAHLRLLRFGRYFCKSVKPNCSECPFQDICVYDNKNI